MDIEFSFERLYSGKIGVLRELESNQLEKGQAGVGAILEIQYSISKTSRKVKEYLRVRGSPR